MSRIEKEKQTVEQMIRLYCRKKEGNGTLCPQCRELLEYLKNANAKLAVASSSPRWEVEKHLNDAGIIDCFSAIICGDMVEKSKPAPDIYIKACEMLNENPEECIALEDSKNGLLSAYRAGCKPIIVPDLWQPDEEILQIIKGKYSDLEQVKKAFESGEI